MTFRWVLFVSALLLARPVSAQYTAVRADGGRWDSSGQSSQDSREALQRRLERQRILSELEAKLQANRDRAATITNALNGLTDLVQRWKLEAELRQMEREIEIAQEEAREAAREAAEAERTAREADIRWRTEMSNGSGSSYGPVRDLAAEEARRRDAQASAEEDARIRARREAYQRQRAQGSRQQNPPATSKQGEYVYKDVRISITGSDWLFVNTPIWAALTDEKGNFTSRPGYLTIRNYGDHTAWFEGVEIGRVGSNLPVAPGQTVTVFLGIYSEPDNPVQSVTATVKFWQSK